MVGSVIMIAQEGWEWRLEAMIRLIWKCREKEVRAMVLVASGGEALRVRTVIQVPWGGGAGAGCVGKGGWTFWTLMLVAYGV